MKIRLPAALSRERCLALLGPSLVLVLGFYAYRPLLVSALSLPARSDVEFWFFTPDNATPWFVSGIAAWLLWRRRARWRSLPPRSDRGMAFALLAIGTGLFLWAQLAGADDLLLPSLASNLLAFAGLTNGRAGCRAVLLPALVLLLAAPIPLPIRNELIWRLQLWTANGSYWVMQTVGYDVALEGLVIRSGEYSFTVIEACSGLRGMEILTLVAVAVRELFAASGRRLWLLVLAAPGLGFALNVVRVVVVVAFTASADPEGPGLAAADHTPQGVAVLIAGTLVLYAWGWWMATAGRRRLRAAAPPGHGFDQAAPLERGWRAAAAWLAVLGVLSIGVAPFPGDSKTAPAALEIPETRSGWSGEDLRPDRRFVGYLPRGQAIYRRYELKSINRPPQIVDLFIGFEVTGDQVSSRLFTAKIAMPGVDWSLGEARRARLWLLGIDAELTIASRESEHALVYSWRVRDDGILRESSRSLLALESGPFRRERRRAVVRLATPLGHDGPVARDRAKQTLDRFIRDFRDELADL